MDLKNTDFARAVRVGIGLPAPSPDDRQVRDLAILEGIFSEIASQWKEHLGWEAKFALEQAYPPHGRGYHLTVRNDPPIDSLKGAFGRSKVLGMIFMSDAKEFAGRLRATDKWEPFATFDGEEALVLVLESFFSSFEIGQFLLKVFDKPKSLATCSEGNRG